MNGGFPAASSEGCLQTVSRSSAGAGSAFENRIWIRASDLALLSLDLFRQNLVNLALAVSLRRSLSLRSVISWVSKCLTVPSGDLKQTDFARHELLVL